MPHAVIIQNIVLQWKFKYILYTVIMKIDFFHTIFYLCQLQNMIKKNNSFISLALGIFFYCNIYITLNESDEVGERTPKSRWNISLESTGVFYQGYGTVLESDQEAWESGGNKIPILNHMAVGFWVPEVHVICLSQRNLKIRENPAIPPKQIIHWSWTDLSRLMAKQHFHNNYWDKTSVQRAGDLHCK